MSLPSLCARGCVASERRGYLIENPMHHTRGAIDVRLLATARMLAAIDDQCESHGTEHSKPQLGDVVLAGEMSLNLLMGHAAPFRVFQYSVALSASS